MVVHDIHDVTPDYLRNYVIHKVVVAITTLDYKRGGRLCEQAAQSSGIKQNL